jgi:hypothetical protein
MAFGSLPEGRQLGHAPPPPRPFGRFGGIVAVDADRCIRGLEVPIQMNGLAQFMLQRMSLQE